MIIEMFMWEWQHVFQGVVKSLLMEVLKVLQIEAVTNTFIIGIPLYSENPNVFTLS